MNIYSIKKFNTFGFRNGWVQAYYKSPDTFLSKEAKEILNEKKQLPIFSNWMISAGLASTKDKTPTYLSKALSSAFHHDINLFWQVVWVNLCNDNELCSWYSSKVNYEHGYSREALSALMTDYFSSIPESTRDNALKSLLNTFNESPLGVLGVGKVIKTGNKTSVRRITNNDLALVTVAYSLYRYAERIGRYSLTVSEFYNPDQTEGIVCQFGIEREDFEATLRSLEQEQNQVLRAELKMGLDNIILREDLTSEDIIKLMLK